MNEKESARISTLTTGAIQSATDSTVKSMFATIEAAEMKISDLQAMVDVAAQKTREMRDSVEQFSADFSRATSMLTKHVGSHVNACQAVIDQFQGHHLNILNVDSQATPNGNGNPHHERLVEDIKKLHGRTPKQ